MLLVCRVYCAARRMYVIIFRYGKHDACAGVGVNGGVCVSGGEALVVLDLVLVLRLLQFFSVFAIIF